MEPQTNKTASGGSWRIAGCLLLCFRTRWIFILLPLLSAGCVGTSAKLLRDRLINQGHPGEYADGYADGWESGYKEFGNPYASFVQNANRYVWDAKYKFGWNDGFNWGEHSNSLPRPEDVPQTTNEQFAEAAHAIIKAKPDSAILAGQEAHRFNFRGEERVLLRSVAGGIIPVFSVGPQLVPAGLCRVLVLVQETGWSPLYLVSPEIEVTFLAQHHYRITSRKMDNQHLIQFWDETGGSAERTLVTEWRGELSKNVRYTPLGGG